MVCHKLGDTSKPVMGPGSAESHLPEDDKDSKDQTIVIKPLPLKASASAPGGEFHPNSSYTGKDSGTNWHMGLVAKPKFVFELVILCCWLRMLA